MVIFAVFLSISKIKLLFSFFSFLLRGRTRTITYTHSLPFDFFTLTNFFDIFRYNYIIVIILKMINTNKL